MVNTPSVCKYKPYTTQILAIHLYNTKIYEYTADLPANVGKLVTQLMRGILQGDELVDLFQSQENIPGDDEFPAVIPKLHDYTFPKHILSTKRLRSDQGRDWFSDGGNGIKY